MTELTKITRSELDTYGVASAPTVLNGTAEENKAVFDRLSSEVLTPRINALIDIVQNYIDLRGTKWDGFLIGDYDADGNTNGIMIKYYDESDGNHKFAICKCTYSCALPSVGQTVAHLLFNKDLCPIKKPFPSGDSATVMSFEKQQHTAELQINAYPQTGYLDTDEVVYALELFVDGQKEEIVYISEKGYIGDTEYEKGWQTAVPEYTAVNGYTVTGSDLSLLNKNALCISGDISVSYEWTDLATKSDMSGLITAATSDSFGMIKVGDRLTISNGVLSANDQSYTLPAATSSTLGGIKVGSRLSISDGVLSASDQSYTLPAATSSTLGGIKAGSGLNIVSDGTLSVKDEPQSSILITPQDGHSYTVSAEAQTFDVLFFWQSNDKKSPPMPTGTATLKFYINNVLAETRTNVSQGQGVFHARQYLAEGPVDTDTLIRMTIEDSFGSVRSAVWTVTVTPASTAGHTVQFKDHNGTNLNTQVVRDGQAAVDPVGTGIIEAPTRSSSIDTVYTFIGWDKALSNITEDTVITAVYGESQRKYTVVYKNGDTVVQTTQAAAYSNVPYNGNELVAPSGCVWLGWDRAAVNVQSDLEIYAVFSDGDDLPSVSSGNYDYVYSEDASDNSRYTASQFYSIIAQNKAEEYFDVGDKIKIVPNTSAFTDSSIVLSLIGFDHFKLADNSGNFAKAVFHMDSVMFVSRAMNATNTNTTSWRDSSMRTFLSGTVYPALPQLWKTIIKLVEVRTSAGGTSDTIITTQDKLFLLSLAEAGIATDQSPYKYEVDPDADSIAFPVFTTDESRTKLTYNGEGTAIGWWLRSPILSSSVNFRYITYVGGNASNTATSLFGVSFGFCL